ncbi:4'-phosphopantetheinyl transferase EntD (siderophore biosynthesis) [Asanoa hainanensis]|uniref:4'-phosphopantetheinyl transferase EntD (Siderophore biosynthesis) n=1 Tax=Asanoa hainanensis TaxID=560556 RepID=A0A239N2F4_9ACTN|nr:4'-phosphopantetheinyl transferase superfamily protein [Asanoa hainanensis]SNT48614.1 4'-phosphopantetheinyl transferase EntD (siderophore biosynthesis) [Asanoa hainanensis]
MIERLLPSSVSSAEAFADVPGEPVHPGEQDLVRDAAAIRRGEFVTARRCAREALARLGYPPAAIRPGPRREPRWPDGAVGSITHCAGYRAAAVARAVDLAGVGIDAEPHGPLPDGVADVVAGPDELAMLARARPGTHWDRVLFSAKESIYKVWYPLTGRWLGFEDVHLAIDPVTSTFRGRILIDGTRADGGPPLTELHGSYLIEHGLVLTAVAVSCGALSTLGARVEFQASHRRE